MTATLPSKEAQSSTLGVKLGRQKLSQERLAVRRRSTIKSNQVAPMSPEIQEALKRHGLGDMQIETDEDQRQVMKLIRAMPRAIPIKRTIRQMLMAGPVKSSKGVKYQVKHKWNSFKISWNEFLYSFEVWRGSLKKIEGHQGTAAVSYFVFLRWLFFLNIFIFLLLFWVITFFQVSFENAGYDKSTMGTDTLTTGVTLANTCTGLYSPNVTYEAFNLFLDFIQGTGWMEKTVMFYGAYTNEELYLAASEYNMPLAYFLTAVAVLLVSLIVMVHNTLSNFKVTVLQRESASQANYCNSVFAGMDYSIQEEAAMALKQKSLYTGLVADLGEQRYLFEKEKRTRGENCKLYTIRFLVNLLILIMLGGAGAAIYYAQDFSSEFTTTESESDYHALVFLLVEFLPSIVIGALNGIFPLIFGILVEFEGYRPATIIKLTLIRTVFLRLASLAMVVTSLYVQITCSTQDSCLVGSGSCPAIQCWETYVGSAIYKLMVSDFFIDVAMTLAVELPRKLITTKCDCGLAKKIGPAVFDIPKNVLDLVYAQTLCWLGFFFAPLVPAICVFRFFVLFYLKKLSAMYSTVPPEKPYHASRSNSFFMVILMVAYFIACIPVGYVMVKMDPSPMCGPFRIYGAPKDIIDVQIELSDQWFQTIWNILTSSAVVAAIIILLALAVYYCSALNSAHKELLDMMKEQLVLEGKDKQYLLAKINELSGGEAMPKKKPPPPVQKSQLKTVDETKPSQTTNDTKPAQNGNVTVESRLYGDELFVLPSPSRPLPLYGKELSMVASPEKDDAPPPADYTPPPPIPVAVTPPPPTPKDPLPPPRDNSTPVKSPARSPPPARSPSPREPSPTWSDDDQVPDNGSHLTEVEEPAHVSPNKKSQSRRVRQGKSTGNSSLDDW